MEQIRFIDLFAGVGGFHLGLTRSSNKFKCVYSNEWNKYANSVYRKNLGECDARDIRTVNSGELPEFDMLCAGFPCQSFSIAGKRRGFEDTRGTMFFEIARIIREKKPRLLLLENVKGLLNHDNGATFEVIVSTLQELGYSVEWQVLNSKNHGVPQNRERVFIIGHLGNECRRAVFPIGSNKESFDVLQGQRVYSAIGICSSLSVSGVGGIGSATGLYAIPVLTPDRPEKRQRGRRFKEDGEPSFTVTAQDRHGIFTGSRIRRLTPTECERLQGFPDDFTKEGLINGNLIPISDSQRYKMMGNAVTVNVIEEIGKKIVDIYG
jgi:DNA (cytosine-5)-methyltransferase 1